MNSITLLNTGVATLGVVDLPGNAKNMHIKDFGSGDVLIYEKEFGHSPIPLPPGNWIILGWSDNLIQEKLWEIGILDYEAWALFLASNGITERKFLIKQVK